MSTDTTALDYGSAEAALFAAMLFSADPQGAILASATPGDFATPGLSALWAWASEQTGPVTPMGIARQAQALALGGYDLPWCMRLAADHVGSLVLWQETAAEVRRLRALRDCAAIATSLAAGAALPAACPQALADEHAIRLVELSKGTASGSIRTVGQLMPDVLEYLERLASEAGGPAIPCGYSEIDAVSPLRPGELTILAARPSVGKSALAANMLTRAAKVGHPSAIVSLEMTSVALARRIVQSEAGVRLASVTPRSGQKERDMLASAAQSLTAVPALLAQPQRLTVSGLRRLVRELVMRHDARVVFVDYLQLVLPDHRASNRNRENEVAEVSAAAKALAVDCQIPVVMLAQLNRQAEGEKPKLSHLRDSGSLEQDADVVWLLDRDRQDGSGTTSLLVAKNRDGECGVKIPLRFNAQTTTFHAAGEARYSGGAGQARSMGPVDDETAERVAGDWA